MSIFILDDTNHLILHYYTNMWQIPKISSCELSHILTEVKILYGLTVNNIVQVDKQIYRAQLSESVDDKLAMIMFDQMHNNVKLRHIRFSELIKLPIYPQFKSIIDSIYNPLKIQLILDIDNTLLDSLIKVTSDHDSVLLAAGHDPDHFIGNEQYNRLVWMRPFMYVFLQEVKALTNVSFWTATQEAFQSVLVGILGLKSYGDRIHYIDECTRVGDSVHKSMYDLNQKYMDSLYDPDRTLLVDDNAFNRQNNPLNSYPIKPWCVDVKTLTDVEELFSDSELIQLLVYLRQSSDQIIHCGYTVPELVKKLQKTKGM